MEACLPNTKTKVILALTTPPYCHRLCRQSRPPSTVKCGGRGQSVPELERKLEEELAGIGGFREKCREVNGVAELLECLEREAIMGEDEGRDPNDYNRRAQIFDKSSRIFQALKEDDGKDNVVLDSSPD